MCVRVVCVREKELCVCVCVCVCCVCCVCVNGDRNGENWYIGGMVEGAEWVGVGVKKRVDRAKAREQQRGGARQK